MTPKEKALKLCQQFGNTTMFADDCNNGYTLPLRVSKLCAHIAVDELILTQKEGDNYWNNVKTEIDNL